MRKLFVQTVFIWVGGFSGGSPSLDLSSLRYVVELSVEVFSSQFFTGKIVLRVVSNISPHSSH